MLNSILPLCGELAKVGGHGYATTEASCTPPWLPSGWGCRGRRLSRERRSPDTRRDSLQCHRPARMNVPSQDGRAILKENSAQYRSGQASSEIRRLPRCGNIRESFAHFCKTLGMVGPLARERLVNIFQMVSERIRPGKDAERSAKTLRPRTARAVLTLG